MTKNIGLCVIVFVWLWSVAQSGVTNKTVAIAPSGITISGFYKKNKNDVAEKRPTWLKENERIFKHNRNIYAVMSTRTGDKVHYNDFLNKLRFVDDDNKAIREVTIYPEDIATSGNNNTRAEVEFSQSHVLVYRWWYFAKEGKKNTDVLIFNKNGEQVFQKTIKNREKFYFDEANKRIMNLDCNKGILKILDIKGRAILEKKYSTEVYEPSKYISNSDEVYGINFLSAVSKNYECIAFCRVPEGHVDFKSELFVVKVDGSILFSKTNLNYNLIPIYVSCDQRLLVVGKNKANRLYRYENIMAYNFDGKIIWNLEGEYRIDTNSLIDNKMKISKVDHIGINSTASPIGYVDITTGKVQ